MAAALNLPREVKESIRDVLDKHVKVSLKRLVRMEVKGDKMDNRVLALSPCRLFLLITKAPSKLENSFHFLDIQSIESKKPSQLTLVVDGKTYAFHTEDSGDDMDPIITHIGISLKHIFPSFPLERLIVKIDVQPPERLKTMYDMIKNIEKKEPGPCGGFTHMYQCMCDYYGQPFREEVAWDVDTIYLSHDSRELRLQDFDHLQGKDLVPIIAALEHNAWFKRINASNVKLTVEACNELVKVMKRNAVIEEMNLSNTGIKLEFVQKFALAIISNSGTQLNSLDLSNNLLEDKAITHLMGAVKLLPCGLTYFDISRTGITTRLINKVGEILAQSPSVMAGLKTLKINDNGLKGDDFPMLYNCLAQPNSITYIDVSATDCACDNLCDPLLRGCLHLTTLKASRIVFTHKRNKDILIPQSWKQLFASAYCLEHVDFSSCRLPAEALKELLLGLSSNRNIKDLYLDLSSNDFGSSGANVLASCIEAMSCLRGLDISNNAFDSDVKIILPEIAKNSYLKQLSIGRNFANIKPKHMTDVMNALTLLLQEDTSVLESLSLADSKLKTDTTYLINAMGSNNTLLELDISGNLIGDIGARMLAKALMINNKLRKVVWDKNNVSAQGFEDVAEALQKNMTMRKMPFPVNDAAVALRVYPDRTEVALQRIESYLQRNHSPRRFASDKAYRLQQGFLISSTQQMVDRLVVQVQDTVNALESLGTMEIYASDVEKAGKLIADANNARQLLPGLQDIALKSQSTGNAVDTKLHSMTESLRQAIEEQMKKTTDEMLKCSANHCPALMANQTFQSSVKEGCQAKITLPKDFTSGVLEGPSADIYNMTGEVNLEVAALISDNIMEEVIDSLSNIHKTLTNHLNMRKSGVYKDEKEKEETVAVSERKKPEGPFLMPSVDLNICASPKFENKRKSMLNRKTRPQSTMGDEAMMLTAKRALDIPENLKLAESEESTPSGSKERLDDFGDLPVTAARPLEHVTKARPRREKAHRPTRPVVATGTTELEEGPNNGINPIYQTQLSQSSSSAVEKEHPPKPSKPAATAKPESHKEAASSKTDGKKWMPGFMKSKNKEDKQDKEKEPKKSNSFGSSFSSIFKKKEDRKRSTGNEVVAEHKSDMESSITELPSADVEETKHVEKSVEPIKEVEPPSDDAGDSLKLDKSLAEATVELPATPEHKTQVTPITSKPTKERHFTDRPALLPPGHKVEAKVATLATQEDDSLLGDVNGKKEPEEMPQIPEKPSEEEAHNEKQEEGPKVPTGVGKIPGLGALGGKNLLEEMKMKQSKRFSQVPLTSPVEDHESAKEAKAAPEVTEETNNNTASNIPTVKEAESTIRDIKGKMEPKDAKAKTEVATKDTKAKTEPMTKDTKVKIEPIAKGTKGKTKPTSQDTKTKTEPISKESDTSLSAKATPPAKVPSPSESEIGKRDLNDNKSGSPTSLPQGTKPTSPAPQISHPMPAPRASRRPVSTVEEIGPPVEPPKSMTTSTPDFLLSDGSSPGARPRPPPPVKPRPAVLPRPRKRESVQDENSASDSAQTSPLTAKTTPVTTVASSPKAPSSVASPASTVNESKPTPSDEGIVYDSATLRLSVKDKIKRLSQAKASSDAPTHFNPTVKEKTASLPKDAKLPDSIPEESERRSRDLGSRQNGEKAEVKSSIQEEMETNENWTPASQAEDVPDDEIMV